MREVMDVLKALADENRVRLLYALKDGELCVCQLVALLELAPSSVSKHLTILRSARLLESRKSGRWMYYRLSGKTGAAPAGNLLGPLFEEIKNADQILKDRKRLRTICSEKLESICREVF